MIFNHIIHAFNISYAAYNMFNIYGSYHKVFENELLEQQP